MDYDEYRHTIDKNEREIAHWEARTTETEKIAMELAMCMDVVHNMATMWESASPEDKQGLARNLFDYLVYDLDTRRLTDFRLKPWADRFLILRASLYALETGEIGEEKQTPHAPEGVHTEMSHRGLEPTACFDIWLATFHIMEMLYETPYPTEPQNDLPGKAQRNTDISARYKQGESLSELAAEYGISEQRVYQIVQGQRK